MNTTRISLLNELCGRETEPWRELDRLYRPLIANWLRRFELQPDDQDDLFQELMTVLVWKIEEFEHNGRRGAFRNWLRTTVVNLARNYLRRKLARGTGTDEVQEMLEQYADPNSDLSVEFDLAHQRHLLHRLLERLENEFQPITLQAFQAHVVESRSAEETAEMLNISVASVYTAKSRVIRRLREHAEHLLD